VPCGIARPATRSRRAQPGRWDRPAPLDLARVAGLLSHISNRDETATPTTSSPPPRSSSADTTPVHRRPHDAPYAGVGRRGRSNPGASPVRIGWWWARDPQAAQGRAFGCPSYGPPHFSASGLPPAKPIDLFPAERSPRRLYVLRPKACALKNSAVPRPGCCCRRCRPGPPKRVFHNDKRVHFDHPEFEGDGPPGTPDVAGTATTRCWLVSLRELVSPHTWFHNVTRLMLERRQTAAGPSEGPRRHFGSRRRDPVAIVSRTGRVEVARALTDEMAQALSPSPGWGAPRGWRDGRGAEASTTNDAASSEPRPTSRVRGNAVFTAFRAAGTVCPISGRCRVVHPKWEKTCSRCAGAGLRWPLSTLSTSSGLQSRPCRTARQWRHRALRHGRSY